MSAFGRDRYTGVAVFLHWLIAILVFVLIGLGWYMVDIPKNTPERAFFFNLHKSIGLTTFFVIALRVAWRLTHVPPRLPASLKRWEAVVANWMHRLLYAGLLIMPISGYVASNFTKFGVKYFGIELAPWGRRQGCVRHLQRDPRRHFLDLRHADRLARDCSVQAPHRGPRRRLPPDAARARLMPVQTCRNATT